MLDVKVDYCFPFFHLVVKWLYISCICDCHFTVGRGLEWWVIFHALLCYLRVLLLKILGHSFDNLGGKADVIISTKITSGIPPSCFFSTSYPIYHPESSSEVHFWGVYLGEYLKAHSLESYFKSWFWHLLAACPWFKLLNAIVPLFIFLYYIIVHTSERSCEMKWATWARGWSVSWNEDQYLSMDV